MKKSFSNLLLFTILILSVSCDKKILPKEESGTPVFYFKGELDGVNVNLEAGNSGYYMNSSHYPNTTGVYAFKGDLKKDNCDNTCDYSVIILINDTKVTLPTEPLAVNTALHPGEYNFNDASLAPLYYKALFKPVKDSAASDKWVWKIVNPATGDTSYGNSYSYQLVLNAGSVYPVIFGYKNGTDCDASHQNMYKATTAFQTTISAKRDFTQFGLVYTFSTTTKGKGSFTYLWDFGDGKPQSTEASPSHTFVSQNSHMYNVNLEVTDHPGENVCVSHYQINANADKTCDANFLADFTPIPDTIGYGAITVIITKPGGEVFSTRNIVQPIGSRFEILSVDEYDINRNNEPTKRLKIKLDCVLRSATKKEIKLTNAEAVFAMSYK